MSELCEQEDRQENGPRGTHSGWSGKSLHHFRCFSICRWSIETNSQTHGSVTESVWTISHFRLGLTKACFHEDRNILEEISLRKRQAKTVASLESHFIMQEGTPSAPWACLTFETFKKFKVALEEMKSLGMGLERGETGVTGRVESSIIELVEKSATEIGLSLWVCSYCSCNPEQRREGWLTKVVKDVLYNGPQRTLWSRKRKAHHTFIKEVALSKTKPRLRIIPRYITGVVGFLGRKTHDIQTTE